MVSFNPLPPPKRGEIEDIRAALGMEGEFQSAPPAEARGDRGYPGGPRHGGRVSIRSPRRSEGRSPNSRSRGQQRMCFNPLPPPKRGEITINANRLGYIHVSIRSPRRSEGRYCTEYRRSILERVSIRSPRRSEGRSNLRQHQPVLIISFNPLPPPKRGEMRI